MRKVLLGLLVAAVAGATARAEILEQVIVKVNGEIITKTELEQRQVAAIRQRNRGAQVDLSDESLKKQIAEVTPQVIVDSIDEMLILQQGRERGYRMGDDQFNAIVERIRKENKLESDETFQAALKQEGMTLADLRRSLERQMIVSRVQGDAIGRVSVSDDEARAYYDAHQNEFTTPAQITLREVLVEVPTIQGRDAKGGGTQSLFNAAIDEDAENKIKALRHRALAGEDFTALVQEASASASKANGGLIGPLNRDELAPALQKVLEKLAVGDVTEPIRTQRGYQIFKVEAVTTPTVLPFDQAREQIANKVYGNKRNAEFAKYLTKLRAQAIIEWRNEEIRKAYEQQVGAPVAAQAAPSS